MADEEKVQVQVSATADDFNQGMQAAVQQLTAAIGQMNSMFSGLAGSVNSAMTQAANSTSTAAANMSSSIKQSAGNISSSIDSIKTVIGTAGIGIVSAFGSAAKSALDYERSLLALSRTSGLTIESASKLAYASSQYGVTAEDLSRNIGVLSRNLSTLQKDSDSTTNVFNRFKIAVEDGSGKLLPTDQILMNIADRFKSMPNGVEKTGLAMQIFGRSGQQMIPMLNQGSEGLQKMGITAEKLGLVMKDTSALTAYSNAQKQWTATLKGLEIQMGNAVLPALTAFSKAITSALQAFNSLDPGIRQTIITVTSVTGAVAAMSFGWGAAAAALTAFGGPFASVGTMMNGMPNLITGTVTGIKGLITGMADATIAVVKYVATGGLFTTASTAMNAAVTATSAVMSGVRTAVLATSLAFSTGGISSIVSYGASLISMNSIIAVARTALMLLYGTVTAGIAVVVALGVAWIGNFGDIQNATAGICDGISYGLNNFASGVKQWASGIADVFASLAKAIASAFVGDFKGAWDAAKDIGSGITEMAKGFGTAFQGVGQAAYAAVTNPGAAWNYAKAAGGALWSGTKNMLGFGGSADNPAGVPGDTPDFSAGNAADKGKDGDKGQSAYEIAKQQYEQQAALEDADARRKAVLWQQYLANVEKTQQEASDYQVNLAKLTTEAKKEQIDIDRANLEKEIAQGKAKTLEAYDQKISLLQREVEMTKAGSVERIKAETAVINAQKEKEQYMLEIEKERQARLQQHQLAEIDLDDQKNQYLKDNYAITEEQLNQLTQQNEDKRYQIKKDALEKALVAAKNDEKEQEKIKTQLLQLEDQYNAKKLQLQQKAYQEQNRYQLAAVDGFSSGLQKALQGLIHWNMTITQMIRSLGQGILESVGNSWVKSIVDRWSTGFAKMIGLKQADNSKELALEQTKQASLTSVAAAGNTARITAAKVANAAAAASGAAAATSVVAANAAAFTALLSMIAAVASSIATIPPTGPAMAAAMMAGVGVATGTLTASTASATAAISSSVAGIASFDVGTWSVPQDMLAVVHKGEPIIPAPFADKARAVLSGEMVPASSAASSPTFSPVININASSVDSKGIKKVLASSSKDMVNILNKEWRNFNRKK